MLAIYCPHCADTRNESEYHHAGEAFIVRPATPDSITAKTPKAGSGNNGYTAPAAAKCWSSNATTSPTPSPPATP